MKSAREWHEGTLADIAHVVMGTSPWGTTCNSIGDGLPLLNGPTEFGSHHPVPVQYTTAPVRRSQPGDILFCVRGSTTGRMNWSDREYAIGRGLAAIRHQSDQLCEPFVRAVIDYKLPELLAVATGSTFPCVSRENIESVECMIPPHHEQRAIARVLGALDDKIELNRRLNRSLEELAQAVFRSWFVDFDPVTAKASGRPPSASTPPPPPPLSSPTTSKTPNSARSPRAGESGGSQTTSTTVKDQDYEIGNTRRRE